MIRIVILQGVKKGFVSVSLAWRSRGERLQRGRAAIAFHWQADKQGAAWRQEGHYQRLGQTEIRASFGPGRQASAHTHSHSCTQTHTHTHQHWKLHRGKTVKPGMSCFALWKCQL